MPNTLDTLTGEHMEPSEEPGLPDTDNSSRATEPDRLESLEARIRLLEERVPKTHLLDRRFLPRAFTVLGHYIVAGLIVYAVVIAGTLFVSAVTGGFGSAWGRLTGDDPFAEEGPRLTSVAKLPVDASGRGTVTGTPTGEMEVDDRDGSFVIVLDDAPEGVPKRSTLDVTFNHSTKVYRDDRDLGDPVVATNDESESLDADPSDADTVVVRFHIEGGGVVADRLDLSDDFD